MPRKYVKSNQCPDNRLNRPMPGKCANTVKIQGPNINSDQWLVSTITGHCRSFTLHIKSSETLLTTQLYQTADDTAVPNCWRHSCTKQFTKLESHHRTMAQVRRPTPKRNVPVYSQPSSSGFAANTAALIRGFPSSSPGFPPPFQYYTSGPSLAGITISNPAGGLNICLLCVLRVVR
jgi:hypothetical protein